MCVISTRHHKNHIVNPFMCGLWVKFTKKLMSYHQCMWMIAMDVNVRIW